jgi:hypothetical protein
MTVSDGRAPRSAVLSYAQSRSFVTIPDERSVSSRIPPHSREAPLMTVSDGRAPRSAVLSSAQSRSFVTIPDDGRTCRPESLLTPERLRS